MTRTRRIYNRRHIKHTKRYDLTQPTGLIFRKATQEEMSEYLTNPLRNSVKEQGFIYHPYASGLCMGHCAHCKNHALDQRRLRKAKKAAFEKEVKDELSATEGDVLDEQTTP
jgi:hypothetical protein